jgi:hypothetical protein
MPDVAHDSDSVRRGIALLLAERWRKLWAKKAPRQTPPMDTRQVCWLILVAQNPKRARYAQMIHSSPAHDVETTFMLFPDEAPALWIWARERLSSKLTEQEEALFLLLENPSKKHLELASVLAERRRKRPALQKIRGGKKEDIVLKKFTKTIGNAASLARQALKKSANVRGPLF